MKDIKRVLLTSFTGLIVFSSVLTAQNGHEKIRSVNAKVDSEQKISVVIDVTGPVNYYLFKISNPPRLVAEFTSALIEIKKKEITLDTFVKEIRIGQYKSIPVEISRIVFDLTTDDVFYDALAVGNKIYLTVATAPELAKVSVPEPEPKQSPVSKRTALSGKKSIARNTPTSEHRKKVEEINAAVEEPAGEGRGTVPDEAPQVKASGGFLQISRRRISLNFHEADIRMVLRAIAEQTGVNFIYGSDVEGTITLKLKDVAFDDAIRLILKLSGLVVEQEADNIIRVITPEELKNERSKAIQFTRVMSLKYTIAGDIKKQLEAVKIEGINPIIGDDPLTNSVIITASPQGLEKYGELISVFDVKPRQVLIEASLLEVDYSEGLDLGIAWGMSNFSIDKKGLTGSLDSVGAAQTVGTVGTPALTFTIGGLLNSNQFNATINALQKRGKAKLLSRPKIVALNMEDAKIISGESLPYTETTIGSGGATTTSTKFTSVGVELTVTPTIHSGEFVTLKVKPKVSTLRQMLPAGPWTAEREATTKVMVKSGDTVVIGGLIKEEDLKAVEQFPLLGDLPIIGYLFKHQQETKDRVELLVFLKPIILE
ncbi:MAG: secretin and TonB N-terminal domain-containing protein [bacterium]